MKLADLHPFSARLDLFTASTAEQLLSTADAHPQMIVKMSHSNTQEHAYFIRQIFEVCITVSLSC